MAETSAAHSIRGSMRTMNSGLKSASRTSTSDACAEREPVMKKYQHTAVAFAYHQLQRIALSDALNVACKHVVSEQFHWCRSREHEVAAQQEQAVTSTPITTRFRWCTWFAMRTAKPPLRVRVECSGMVAQTLGMRLQLHDACTVKSNPKFVLLPVALAYLWRWRLSVALRLR
jgi:hypothetical protein